VGKLKTLRFTPAFETAGLPAVSPPFAGVGHLNGFATLYIIVEMSEEERRRYL